MEEMGDGQLRFHKNDAARVAEVAKSGSWVAWNGVFEAS
jgi:hypothetical protein